MENGGGRVGEIGNREKDGKEEKDRKRVRVWRKGLGGRWREGEIEGHSGRKSEFADCHLFSYD